MNKAPKTSISIEKIALLVKKAFGENTEVKAIKEIKIGFFNTAYLLTIRDNEKIVLKISPPKDVKVMRYEKNIMVNEVLVIKKIRVTGGVPLPEVLYYDGDRDIIENEYFFMKFLPGIPLDNIYDELTEQQRSNISSELGKYAKQITCNKSDFFGDISKKDKQFSTWSEAFLFMISELLEDAKENRVKLIYDYDEIYRMIENHSDILDKVEKASLIHKDLWKGNIFVDPQSAEIKGIVDYERAIYGDILLEPVCGFLLHDIVFMNNYIGRTFLEKDEKIRSIMYRIYLFILMVVECSFRQYPWENSDKWAREQLGEAFEDLLGYNV
jgi:aminoglycoside phosphotransferase (APT) family kinase protein